jgi:hypothetical protein
MFKKNRAVCAAGSEGPVQIRLPQCGIAAGLAGRSRRLVLWPRDEDLEGP